MYFPKTYDQREHLLQDICGDTGIRMSSLAKIQDLNAVDFLPEGFRNKADQRTGVLFLCVDNLVERFDIEQFSDSSAK